MKLKLSQWHDGSVKPVHEGVYERYDINGEQNPDKLNYFSRWDRYKWFSCSDTVIYAYETEFTSMSQCLPWRGIVKE